MRRPATRSPTRWRWSYPSMPLSKVLPGTAASTPTSRAICARSRRRGDGGALAPHLAEALQMTGRYALTGARIFDGDGWHDNHTLVVNGEHVEAIAPLTAVPPGIKRVELSGGTLV